MTKKGDTESLRHNESIESIFPASFKYQEVADLINREICEGKFKVHQKLPSVRTTSARLAVSNVTTDRAYRLLKKAGVVVYFPRRGFYVVEKVPA